MINKRSLQNLNALMMLLAVDKYQSKRKVAENTNTSIDTVNKYLRNLEQNLGVQLVVNSTNGCRLTPRAKNIIAKLQDISDILDQIYNQRPEDNKYKGDVSVCLPLAVGTNFLLDDISGFFDTHPDVKITSLTTVESPNYEEIGADLAIVFTFDESSKHYSLLYQKSMELCLFASSTYLNKYGFPKDIDDLIKNHRIADSGYKYAKFEEWKEILDKAKHCSFSSNSNYAVKQAIKHGSGIGIMPRNCRQEDLVMLDNFQINSALPLYLIVNNNTKDIPRVKAVADYYRKLLDQM